MLINYRDFGGLPSKSGGTVATGLLFRSGHFGGATDAEVGAVLGHDFQAIADLRYAGEREAEPSPWPDSYAGRVYSHDGERTRESPHLELLRTGKLTPETAKSFYLSMYGELALDPLYRGLFAEVVRTLGSGVGKSLIHCSAGKDRTGILCALILDLLEVDRADVENDYLRSLNVPGFDGIKAGVRERTRIKYGHVILDDALEALMGVKADYIREAFRAIDRTFGGVEGYFRESGLSNEDISRVKARYIRV